ncbi:MAG: sulfotransferase [Chloroflexota bacterium]|nr:sulfotransferase [Chloroflexota bacterium]
MSGAPRPIFVIGSRCSGASLLTWSLGQHPSLLPLLDSSWLEPFAVSLEHTYAVGVQQRSTSQLDIAGIEIEDFFEHFGRAVDWLLISAGTNGSRAATSYSADLNGHAHQPVGAPNGCQPTRWVDGSPTNCFNVVGLHRLFPEGKFIHVLRDADSVVATLTDPAKRATFRSHWQKISEEAAYEHWLETVQACVDAERALGSATVLRILRDDLLGSPESTLRRCLDFVGESFDPVCLRPFR